MVYRIKYIILAAIIFLAFVLRFYHLDSYPALNADEAAIGYNAYSLIQTGHDEHGNAWPIHFQSFNDYKPGLYFYLVLPFVKVLGLTEWAVRIPNALLGVATVYVLYLLTKELFKNEKYALISSFFLAISPWHIHFSRGGWETNVATFFISFGILMFLKYFNGSKRSIGYIVYSILAFVASLYTYHAARIVVPILGVGLVFIYKKEIIKNLKPFLVGVILGLVLLLPLLIDFTKGGVLSRAAGVGLFADPGPRSRIEEQRGEHVNINGIVPKLIHNKVVNYGLAFLLNYGKHFHGEFLFLSGDEVQRNRVPETGQMYIIDLLFILVGIVSLFKLKVKSQKLKVLFLWLITAPVASALTFQSPSALRAENMVIPLVMISAFGAFTLLEYLERINSNRLRKIFYIVCTILVLGNFVRYIHMYYTHMAEEYPYSSQYGVKELVGYVKENEDKFQKVLITDRYDQPYILFLFYMKYPPEVFQKDHTLTNRDGFGFSTVNHFGKYYFASIKYDEARPDNPNTLIVGTNEEIPKEANVIKNIYGSNGFLYFKAVAN